MVVVGDAGPFIVPIVLNGLQFLLWVQSGEIEKSENAIFSLYARMEH